MSTDPAYAAAQPGTVIDVREPGEFASFYIPGAVKVPLAEIIVGRAGTAGGCGHRSAPPGGPHRCLAGPAELMRP